MQYFKPLVKNGLRNLYWTLYGKSLRNPDLSESPLMILFICKGNICRSPFAERLSVKLGRQENLHPYRFYSAGLEVSKPMPSPPEAISAARRFGIDLDNHRSRKLTHDILQSSDIILAMEAWQFKNLRKSFPAFERKIFLLPLFEQRVTTTKLASRQFYNILDPYGNPEDVFIQCFQRIASCLNELFVQLKRN